VARRSARKVPASRNRSRLKVWIAVGSDSDLPVMQEAVRILEEFGVPCEVDVTSAHRSPEATARYARSAETRGFGAIIVGAGHAAHLGGVVAAHSTLPVIGVPLASSDLAGMDALLSTVQMPGGVPVACMAIGKAGARNAGLFAVQILATHDPELRRRLHEYKTRLAAGVIEKNRSLKVATKRSGS
jgi:phosphoribosylaminoimidazole carboxylase PurE protein